MQLQSILGVVSGQTGLLSDSKYNALAMQLHWAVEVFPNVSLISYLRHI